MMWQRFTERARRVIFFSQEEAGRLGENYVSTEHILLGIVREDDTVAARVLITMGLTLRRIRSEINRQVTQGEGRLGQDMQLTPRAKRVIDLAYEEARGLGNNYIGTEHLLLGLIVEGEGLAGRVLNKLGVEVERARKEVWLVHQEDPKLAGRYADTASAPPRLTLGVLGELRPQKGRDVVEVAWTQETMAALQMIFEARDGVGYENLIHAGGAALLTEVTEAKLLSNTSVVRALLVRLRSGPHAGKTAWVFSESFMPTEEDDAPFPPKVELKS